MTDTEVANKALDHLGEPRINDIDDDTDATAIKCEEHFDDSRKYFLREAAPGFARKEVALAISAGETLPTEMYDYIYGYPSDCIGIRQIYNPNGVDAPRVVFEIGNHSNKTSQVILTDQEDAILIYTVDVVNLNLYSPDDILALSYALAWHIAMPITRNRELRQEMQQYFVALLSVSRKNNLNTQHTEQKKLTRYKDARR
jgi:hypothetical protein